MSNLSLYLYDYAPFGTITSTGVTSVANATTGIDTMVCSFSAATATITLTCASTAYVGAVAFANHNIPNSATVKVEYGGWTECMAATAFAGYIDQLFDFGSSYLSTTWRITLTGVSGFKCGAICFLSRLSYHKLAFTNAYARFPIGQEFDAGIAAFETVTGAIIQQRIGGAFRRFSYEIPNVKFSSATSGTEEIADHAFLDEIHTDGGSMLSQGWPFPLWLVDDAGKAYHCTLERPVRAAITGPSGRGTLGLNFRTVPKLGLT